MTRTYLMTLECFASGLEVLVNQPQLFEKERTEQMKLTIDKILDKYKS